MASDESEGGNLSSHLEFAEDHFDQALKLFKTTIERIHDGDDLSFAEVDKASRALFNAAHTLLNFKVRIYDERKRQEGVVHGYALDLEDARTKVGRLLDRLRADRSSD